MDKSALYHFPRLKEGDEVLYINEYDSNINSCTIVGCSICINEMKKYYAGYLRDGIYHYETKR